MSTGAIPTIGLRMVENEPATPSADAAARTASDADHFHVEVPGFSGSLEQLVLRAHRGEVDLDKVLVAEITSDFRARVERPDSDVDLRELADFLTLAARLVSLKAARLNPGEVPPAEEDDQGENDDTGRRLTEYRLFKAAAEALLGEAQEEGARSFLSLVVPDVLPVERLRIPPERLAAAFRDILTRLSDAEPLPVGAATFSVEDKMAEIRERLRGGPLAFEALFEAVASRLEAVAAFLALLELLRRGEAEVDQAVEFGPITVRAHG